jgi:hypothetical protein
MLWLHRCKCGGVGERQVADGRKIVATSIVTIRSQTRRMCWRGKWSVVGGGGERVVREGRRGGRGGLRGVRSGALRVTMRVMVVRALVMGVTSRHRIGGERREMVATAVRAVAVVWVVSVGWLMGRKGGIPLDLGSSCGEEVNLAVVGRSRSTVGSSIRIET